jgi:hypothetical protein
MDFTAGLPLKRKLFMEDPLDVVLSDLGDFKNGQV